jgi:hypothetical protein
MSAVHRLWSGVPSGHPETTHPLDGPALVKTPAANDDDYGWSVDVFVEADGEHENEPGPLSFFIAGAEPSVVRMQRARRLATQAQGLVKRIDEERVILGTPGSSTNEITVGYRLPASLDLRPLVGRRVCVALEEEEPPSGGRSWQTLTMRAPDDRVWLVARYGEVHEVTHSFGAAVVRVTLSPNDGGPLVVAPPEVQHIVAPGGEARMRVGASRYVVELVSRNESGCAAYFIADDRLWH